jgi:DNA helicase HerA-like ATPase
MTNADEELDIEGDRLLHSSGVVERSGDTASAYRIISKNVTEYEFIIPYKERAYVGELFMVDDILGDMRFLCRATDISHDSNYSGPWDTVGRGIDYYDEDQIFNRVRAMPLGCVEGNSFRKSRTIPTKFSRIHRAVVDEFGFLLDVMGDIEVGSLRNGLEVVKEIPVALHSSAMDHHMGVFATTGMGKSNFMKVFAASCMKLAATGRPKFGLLIVDPHGEYLKGRGSSKGLIHLKRYQKGLRCYSTDRQNCEMAEVEELTISKKDVIPEDLFVLYDWSSAQRDALEAISRVFDRESWLEEIQTKEGLAHLISEEFSEKTAGVVSRRIKHIMDKNRYIRDRSSIRNIISNLSEGLVVLIDIPRIREKSELFLLSVISRCIMDEYSRDVSFAEAEKRKNCLIAIEEAQRVLGGEGGSSARFASIAREGRKFGVGLCAITQQPKLIDKQLLSQFNTLVIMGLSDRMDRQNLEESAKQDLTSLDIEIQTLEKGEAIISSLLIPFPVSARIHKYEDYLKTLNSEKQQNAADAGIMDGKGFRPSDD